MSFSVEFEIYVLFSLESCHLPYFTLKSLSGYCISSKKSSNVFISTFCSLDSFLEHIKGKSKQ
ncbi:hypothetical protein HERIO_1537 [Hepatospora eriocheir]|uniref:Uncharacterized protein n=1 Tax=Hepatospora eriocheir TaxID=1081669 RepID=A0A1X0QA28_9MICR|nr:hypothetical protein HERIO_1537 [Hepatospora eriocheir]